MIGIGAMTTIKLLNNAFYGGTASCSCACGFAYGFAYDFACDFDYDFDYDFAYDSCVCDFACDSCVCDFVVVDIAIEVLDIESHLREVPHLETQSVGIR